MKHWTPEEVEYLKDSWGYKNIPNIAKHLNRNVNAIS
jgi:ribonucleotide reductase beta subunit family protein with ferritin-like domain